MTSSGSTRTARSMLGGWRPERSDIDVLVVVERCPDVGRAVDARRRVAAGGPALPGRGPRAECRAAIGGCPSECPPGVRAARHHRARGRQGRRRARPPRRPGPRPPLRHLPRAGLRGLRRGPSPARPRPGRRRADLGRGARGACGVRRPQRLPRLALRRRRDARLEDRRRPLGRREARRTRTNVGSERDRPAVRRGDGRPRPLAPQQTSAVRGRALPRQERPSRNPGDDREQDAANTWSL